MDAERGVQFDQYRISPIRNLCMSSALCWPRSSVKRGCFHLCLDIYHIPITYGVFVAVTTGDSAHTFICPSTHYSVFVQLLIRELRRLACWTKHRGIEAYDVRRV